MSYPADRLYSEDHLWVQLDGSIATVGITPYALDALGEIVFVDLPEVGTNLIAQAPLGEVESTKSVSELYTPLSGVVVERNEAVKAGVHLLNEDVWGAWLVRLEVDPDQDRDHLLTAQAYQSLTDEG